MGGGDGGVRGWLLVQFGFLEYGNCVLDRLPLGRQQCMFSLLITSEETSLYMYRTDNNIY